jgi:hypothetical protein
MRGVLAGQVRLEQSAQLIAQVRDEVAAWVAHRRAKDPLRQYHSQLRALETALCGSLDELRGGLGAVGSGRSTGEVYQACRAFDQRVTLVRRTSAYFETRFAQRDDPRFGPLLAAADEVAWSCYAEAFRNATLDETVARGTSPLPYIEFEDAPAAVVRDDLPGTLAPERTDTVLARHLALLPVPLVRLPASILGSPWWLVYLGHEVGHHLQHDLVPGWGLVGRFGELLAEAAGAEAGGRWRRWGEEIFADVCSVVCMGPWAVWALVELELAPESGMLTANRPRYPAALVRLELAATVAELLGLDGRVVMRGLDPAASAAGADGPVGAAARRDLELVPAVAERVLSTRFDGVGTLRDLYERDPDDHEPGGRIDGWVAQLLGRAGRYPEPGLRTPRDLAAAGVAAYAEAAGIGDQDDRAAALAGVAETLPALIVASREVGTRAASPVAEPDLSRLGADLAASVFDAVPEG